MNIIDALKERHSVRAFKSDPVSRDSILNIMDGAIRTPSWANTQPWEIYVAGGETLEKIREGFLNRFDQKAESHTDLPRPQDWPPSIQARINENIAHRFKALGIDRNDEKARKKNSRLNFEFFGAPAIIYLCMDKSLTAWSVFDMGLMAQSIMLAAKELGLDTIPAVSLVAYPDLIRSELGIPDNLMLLIGIAIGYADTENPVNQVQSLRRSVEEVVRFEGIE